MRLRLVLVLLLPALAGCQILIGPRIERCGETPEGGGPSVIVTIEQELCEVVRLRVIRQLEGMQGLTRETIDRLVDRALTWEKQPTLDRLIAMIRKDAGDEMANEVERAATGVLAHSQRTPGPDCEDVQRCLVKGAAKGSRIALEVALPTARTPNDVLGMGSAK